MRKRKQEPPHSISEKHGSFVLRNTKTGDLTGDIDMNIIISCVSGKSECYQLLIYIPHFGKDRLYKLLMTQIWLKYSCVQTHRLGKVSLRSAKKMNDTLG